jgi:transposase-like protein
LQRRQNARTGETETLADAVALDQIKTRGSFPNEEAALQLLYLVMERVAKKWTRPVLVWKAALNRFAILFEE